VWKIYPRFRTPCLTQTSVGLSAMFSTGVFSPQLLRFAANTGTLPSLAVVCVGVWILRPTRPDLARPCKTASVPVLPILAVVRWAALRTTIRHVGTGDPHEPPGLVRVGAVRAPHRASEAAGPDRRGELGVQLRVSRGGEPARGARPFRDLRSAADVAPAGGRR